MGDSFKKVLRAYAATAGVAMRTISTWAGRKKGAAQRWAAGEATPPWKNLQELLQHVEGAEWRRRFVHAWEQDNTPSHLWAEVVSHRDKQPTPLPLRGPPSAASVAHDALAALLATIESDDEVGALTLMLQKIQALSWPECEAPVIKLLEGLDARARSRPQRRRKDGGG